MDTPDTARQATDKRRLLEQRLRSGIDALTQGKAAAVEGRAATPSRGTRADADVFEPFPLTDMQEAYWLGRQTAFELGGTSIHSYRETEIEDLDLERLNAAWWALVQRHAALRSVVTQSGMQRIVQDTLPYRIPLVDLRGEEATTRSLDATRQEMSHRLFPLDTWPQWEIRATRIDSRLTRLHIGFDGMLIDDRSYQILIREWLTLYREPAAQLPPLEYSYRDFVLEERARRESPVYTRALDYWRGRVASLPDSARLPLAKSFRTVEARFVRYHSMLDRDAWGRLKKLCLDRKITPAGLLLSCFIEVLGRWSRSPELTVSVPTLNRPPFHEHINNVVGDFGSFILVGNDGLTSGVFLDRVQGIQQRLWDGLEHDSVSGVRIIRELMLHKKAPGSIQVPVVFTMASSFRDRQARAETKAERIDVLYGITQTPQVYLDHQAAELHDALHFNWDVIEELFRPGLMRALFESYCGLLRQLAADESILQQACPVDIPADQRRERTRANATEASIPDGLLHDFGGALDDETARGPAVISDGRTLSHRELTRLSDALAHRLVQEQVRPNELVAIVADKGWEQVVAARAILASGAAYLPVAADLPADYREKLLERARVRIVLTPRVHLPAEHDGGRLHVPIDDPSGPETAVGVHAGPDDLAYVIFTSGSTGEPKGVMITHRSAVNTVHDVNTRFGVTSRDRILAISSLSFDLSVYDIFGALAVGAGIVVPASGSLRDAAYLLRLMHEQGVTLWNSVPALMEMLVQYAEDTSARLPSSLRLVMMSGDWIPVGLPDRIRALCDHVEIVSLGGATEAAIWSIFFPIHTVDPSWSSIPYGRPLANQRFHVIDAEDRDCPVWVPGRLCIEGTGLAAGYWGDRTETDRRFRVRAGTGTRIYDTGDWGLYRPGGDIEFLGRDDRQVKINGFRVELDEIEAHLSRHASVARAAVLKNKANQLLAVVVPRDASCSASALKAYLSESLPAYMVPPQFRLMDHLPLTANGKIDYGALQRDSGQQVDARPSAAPTDRRGQQLIEDIREILGLETVDTSQSLIALGAGSLEIVRLSNRARAYAEGRLKLTDYFEAPSIDVLLAAFEESAPEPPVSSRQQRAVRARPAPEGDLSAAISHVPAGLRTDLHGIPAVQLIRDPEQDSSLWDTRRSHRRYALRPIGFQAVSQLLQPLASWRCGETVRYRYASASSLYPVQVYLHLKQGRVSGLLGGDYYYHPEQQRLFELNRGGSLDRDIYGDRNRPIYDQAALCVFLVCPLDTVEAFYGEWGYDLAMYEAGSMGQLLRDSAPPLGIGLCSIGTLDFARIRARFGVDARHLLLHSFVCGAIGDGVAGSVESDMPASEWDRATRLLQRIDALSEAEARHLDSCMPGDAREVIEDGAGELLPVLPPELSGR
jgi:amino acid adenylation domain-containing protein